MGDNGTGDGLGDTAGTQADYAAWRERMRSKSQKNRALFVDDTPTEEPAGPGPSGYWSSEQVYADSTRVREEQGELLAVLDLRDTASPREIARAYRNLAKAHHPDRWAMADPETREYHEDCMRAVNEAYQALRAAHRV